MNNLGYNQYTSRRGSPGAIIASWLGVVASLAVLALFGAIVRGIISSFQSCDVNNGLAIKSCGKASLTMSDLILIALFIGALVLVMAAVTHALRVSRKSR